MQQPLATLNVKSIEAKVDNIEIETSFGRSFFMLIISSNNHHKNNMEKKMLREIANDKLTPKKNDFENNGELFENQEEIIDEWKIDGPVPLAEY